MKRVKTLTEGPLGFLMPDELAKSLDSLIKTLPSDCKYQRKASVPESIQLLPGERADVSTLSTDSLDRQNEVVIAKGIGLEYFRKNPIVTWCHDYNALPIGKGLWCKLVGNKLVGKTYYAKRPSDWEGEWLADAVFSMTKEGILRGKSIGFLPTKVRSPTREEITNRPEWKNASVIIESGELLEWACCPLPVNQDALVQAVAKGIATIDTLKQLGIPTGRRLNALRKFDPLEALSQITLSPDRIAKMVIDNLKNQGRV